MSGIAGYAGIQNCVPILIDGLKKLEYRCGCLPTIMAALRGCDVDKPRNLAKPVTVE